MSSISLEPRQGRLQRIHVDAAVLRKEFQAFRAAGITVDGMDDYLSKYHGFKHFVMTNIYHDGPTLEVDIRHIGPLERLRGWLRGL